MLLDWMVILWYWLENVILYQILSDCERNSLISCHRRSAGEAAVQLCFSQSVFNMFSFSVLADITMVICMNNDQAAISERISRC
jgi:hypothetical protein